MLKGKSENWQVYLRTRYNTQIFGVGKYVVTQYVLNNGLSLAKNIKEKRPGTGRQIRPNWRNCEKSGSWLRRLYQQRF